MDVGDYRLGSPGPEAPGGIGPRLRRLPLLTVVPAAVAALCVGVAGAGLYAVSALSGGGTQPEDVLPRDAIGFVKIDLDPSADQKIAAYQLAKKFPDSGVKGEDQLRDGLVGAFLAPGDQAAYDADVKPWLGQRAGVAFLAPDRSAPDAPGAVAAVQVTDRAEAERGLTHLAESGQVHYAFGEDDDYVLLADRQDVADAAAKGEEHLADAEAFSAAVDALDGDQIALAWADVGAAWKTLPAAQRKQAQRANPGLAPTGTVALGGHVTDDGLEIVGVTLGLSAGSAPELKAVVENPLGRSDPEGLVEDLPADSLGALGITGAGEGLATLYETLAAEADPDGEAEAFFGELGLRLPADLMTVLGTELAAAVGGDLAGGAPRFQASVRTEDPDRALQLLTRARDAAAKEGGQAPDVQLSPSDDGYTVSSGTGASEDRLGDDEVFRRTLPDAGSSGITLYVDLRRAVEQVDAADRQSGTSSISEQQRRNLAPLQAAGCTSTVDEGGNATFRLRLTVEE